MSITAGVLRGQVRWPAFICAMVLLAWRRVGVRAGAGCSGQNNCNGHGICRNTYSYCDCYVGWGAKTDIADYKAPDCSLSEYVLLAAMGFPPSESVFLAMASGFCPAGRAWGDVPRGTQTAHRLAECSGRGTCDRGTGLCKCQAGFSGDACQRKDCINDCSGHGQCMSMKQLATMASALPLSNATTYTGNTVRLCGQMHRKALTHQGSLL